MPEKHTQKIYCLKNTLTFVDERRIDDGANPMFEYRIRVLNFILPHRNSKYSSYEALVTAE